MLKNQWRRRREEMLCVGLSMIIVYVIVIVCCCILDQGENALIKRLPLGIFLGYIAALIIHVIYSTCTLTNEFNLAVSMSVTRKAFLQSYLWFSVLEWIGVCVAAFVLGIVEKMIYNMVLDGAMILWKPTYGILVLCLMLVALGAIACETFLAACAMRYGWHVMWGIVAAVVMVLIPTLVRIHILPDNVMMSFLELVWLRERSFDFYTAMDMGKIAVLLVALLMIGHRMLKKQSVTYK